MKKVKGYTIEPIVMTSDFHYSTYKLLTRKDIEKLRARAISALSVYSPPAKVERVDAYTLLWLCDNLLDKLKLVRRK
jgi:hypothetical protein